MKHSTQGTGASRLIGSGDLGRLLDAVGVDDVFDLLIDRLRAALRRHDPQEIHTFDRTGFHYTKPELGLIEWMPAMEVGRIVGIKTVGYHPTNPVQRGVPSVLATVSLYDTLTGQLLGIVEGTTLTALRTGAASAVAAELLAIEEASTLGVIGCGAQAVTQVHALGRVRPIERVVAADTDEAVADSLANRLAHLDVAVEIVEPGDPRLLADTDILTTCTSVGIGEGPVFDDTDHRPWLHVNAVGADFAGKHEVPRSLLERAFVVPDVTTQCVLEGECQVLDPQSLGPDLPSLVGGDFAAGPDPAGQLTVFDSTGWALEDLVAAELVLELADQHGIGTTIDLLPGSDDPYDPLPSIR